MAIDQKLVMVPAQAGVDGPVAEVDEILDVGGLFEIGVALLEAEGLGSARVELGGVGNVVAEIFVQENVVGFHAEFDFVASAGIRDAALEVALAKAIVLKDFDGRGI